MNTVKIVVICLALFSFSSIQAQWIATLPQDVQDAILWEGDMEEGTLNDWSKEEFQFPGGGIFNTGEPEVEANVINTFSHSGDYAAQAIISNAWQAQNGSRAVRLMRWTDKPWDDGGDYFPEETYYSAYYYFPETYNPNKYDPWDPGDGGWWNVFQFKSDDANGNSQPLWVLNIYHDDQNNLMIPYLYTPVNSPNSIEQSGDPLSIPVEEWVHFEAYYKGSTANMPDGEIKFWMDGQLLFEAANVITRLDEENVVWGIGNYTDHIQGSIDGSAEVYFDDCIISTVPIHPYASGVLSVNDTFLEKETYRVYPNPVANQLYLNKLPTDSFIKLTSASGQLIPFEIDGLVIQTEQLASGLYFLTLDTQTLKFLKE